MYMPPGTLPRRVTDVGPRHTERRNFALFAAKISSAVLFDASAIYTYLRLRTSTGSRAVSFVT